MIGDLRNYYRVLDSVKAGKRLSEANYPVINVHSQSQRSIKGFTKAPLATTNTALETTKKVGNTAASGKPKAYTKVSD